MSGPNLDMSGTARAAWQARSAWAAANPLPPPRYVVSADVDVASLAAVRDGPALLQLARELAALAPPGPHRRVVLHLALAMLVLGQDGTTTLPLDAAGRAALDKLLLAFDPQGETFAAIHAMLTTAQVPAELAHIVAASGPTPLVLAKDTLALHRFARLEAQLARTLKAQLDLPPFQVSPDAVKAAFLEVAYSAGFVWTVDQQRALLNAVHLPFTVVSGGPGTGKTTLVVSLLRLLARLGISPARMALAAPTGKAANRIYEEVRRQLRAQKNSVDDGLLQELPEPRTLHRLLGYSPSRDRFGTGHVNPLDVDLVVVDESSMVDIFLMERLFRACSTRKRDERPLRLVLLGDANQLPSVEAGMVLHHLAQEMPPLAQPWMELIVPGGKPSTATPVSSSTDVRARILTTLTWSHRMDPSRPAGKVIFETAEAIRRGEAHRFDVGGDMIPDEKAAAGALAFSHVEHLPVVAQAPEMGQRLREDFFPRWWEVRFEKRDVSVSPTESVPLTTLWKRTYRFHDGNIHKDDEASLRALLAASESQRVLCLTRGQAAEGAERSNAWFAERRKKWALDHHESKGRRFYSGEPVLFTVNNYALGLFNGYCGAMAWTTVDDGTPTLRAIFENTRGLQAYDVEQLGDHLERAYAMTVHKAQGSQVECAAVLLPVDENSPLLVRQLLYTAVSRASDGVVLVGDLLRVVTATQRPVQRFSRVMEKAVEGE